MKIVSINKSNENLLFDFVHKSPAEYFFFILDYQQFPQYTQIHLALDENNQIDGLALVYVERILQLRGSLEAAVELLKTVPSDLIEIQAPPSLLPLVKAKFPTKTREISIFRLKCTRETFISCQKIDKTQNIIPLSALDLDHCSIISSIMRQSDSDFWGHAIPEDISMDPAKSWIGIKEDDEFVAITGFWTEPWTGCIAIVATLPEYQNKGYATALVSNALETIFQKSSIGILHVRADNSPALHTYRKVGFKPFLDYVLIK